MENKKYKKYKIKYMNLFGGGDEGKVDPSTRPSAGLPSGERSTGRARVDSQDVSNESGVSALLKGQDPPAPRRPSRPPPAVPAELSGTELADALGNIRPPARSGTLRGDAKPFIPGARRSVSGKSTNDSSAMAGILAGPPPEEPIVDPSEETVVAVDPLGPGELLGSGEIDSPIDEYTFEYLEARLRNKLANINTAQRSKLAATLNELVVLDKELKRMLEQLKGKQFVDPGLVALLERNIVGAQINLLKYNDEFEQLLTNMSEKFELIERLTK